MRIIPFPARYASEIARTIDGLRAQIRADAAIGGEDSPWPNGFIEKDDRTGTIYVLVAELPEDSTSRVLELSEQLTGEKLAS
jgi:hypothetical protein